MEESTYGNCTHEGVYSRIEHTRRRAHTIECIPGESIYLEHTQRSIRGGKHIREEFTREKHTRKTSHMKCALICVYSSVCTEKG